MIGQISINNQVLRIEQDNFPVDPRSNDNLGRMVMSHKRYNLPNEIDLDFNRFSSFDEVENHIVDEYNPVAILPIYMYDHSGISISTSLTYPYNDSWDAGQVGFIFANKEDLEKMGLEDRTPDDVSEMLRNEVTEYDHYLRGDCYSYTLSTLDICDKCKHKSSEVVDSSGGFYNIDDMIGCVPSEFNHRLEKRDFDANDDNDEDEFE